MSNTNKKTKYSKKLRDAKRRADQIAGQITFGRATQGQQSTETAPATTKKK